MLMTYHDTAPRVGIQDKAILGPDTLGASWEVSRELAISLVIQRAEYNQALVRAAQLHAKPLPAPSKHWQPPIQTECSSVYSTNDSWI